MNSVPDLFLVDSQPGADFEERWSNYIKTVYQRYLQSVAFGNLRFRGLPVRCQFRPETHGKHYAFWHMIQEGSGGRIEDERTPDLRRCERIDWIAWCIRAAEAGVSEIRVFPQQKRGPEQPWALWLPAKGYVVILWERKDYFLLKTAFCTRRNKERELQRDWETHRARKD